MILSFIWLFFSLPWLMLVMMFLPMAFDTGYFAAIETLGLVAIGPPLLWGIVLYCVRLLTSGGRSTVNAAVFLAILRVVLWILGGALGAGHILSRNPNLCANADSTWVGANLLSLCCVTLAVAWGLGFWASKGGTDSEPRKQVVGFLQAVLMPFVWIAGCFREAIANTKATP